MSLLRLVFVGAVAVGTALSSTAQSVGYESQMLARAPGLTIVVEDAGPAGQKCGLNADNLRRAISFPLISSNVKIVDHGEYWLHITPLTGSDHGGCVTSCLIEVFYYGMVDIDGETSFQQVVIWRDIRLITSPQNQHAKAVQEALDASGKALVVSFDDAKRGKLKRGEGTQSQ
jgi:hypothetical protein